MAVGVLPRAIEQDLLTSMFRAVGRDYPADLALGLLEGHWQATTTWTQEARDQWVRREQHRLERSEGLAPKMAARIVDYVLQQYGWKVEAQ